MSHTTKYNVDITDRECAVKALQRMGYNLNQIEDHEVEQDLFDYGGRRMNLKANVIVRKQNLRGAVNDFGIRINEDGGEILADGGQIDPKRLMQYYGVEKGLKEADAMGYFTSEEVMEDGRIRLRMRR